MKILSYSIILKEQDQFGRLTSKIGGEKGAKDPNIKGYYNTKTAINRLETLTGIRPEYYPEKTIDTKNATHLLSDTIFDFLNTSGKKFSLKGLKFNDILFNKKNELNFIDDNSKLILMLKLKTNVNQIDNNNDYVIEKATIYGKRKLDEPIENLNGGKFRMISKTIRSIPKTN